MYVFEIVYLYTRIIYDNICNYLYYESKSMIEKINK